MPFTTYEELLAAVEEWLVRPDLTDAIRDFVYLAEVRVQQDLNLVTFEKEATGSLVIDQDHIVLPTDLLQIRFFSIPGTDPPRDVTIVSPVEWEQVRANLSGSGKVAFGYTRTNRLYLAAVPTAADAYKLIYQAGITHLKDASPDNTNKLLTDYPNLLLYGALLEAEPFRGRDERTVLWAGMYADRLKEVKRIEWRNRAGGGRLRMVPDTATP
jgi:hypothetical protein